MSHLGMRSAGSILLVESSREDILDSTKSARIARDILTCVCQSTAMLNSK